MKCREKKRAAGFKEKLKCTNMRLYRFVGVMLINLYTVMQTRYLNISNQS